MRVGERAYPGVPGVLISPATADRIGVGTRFDGHLLRAPDAISGRRADRRGRGRPRRRGRRLAGRVVLRVRVRADPARLLGASLVVTVGASAIATALAGAESHADLATLAAVGASPGVRRRLSMAQAATVALIGAVLGVLAGVGARGGGAADARGVRGGGAVVDDRPRCSCSHRCSPRCWPGRSPEAACRCREGCVRRLLVVLVLVADGRAARGRRRRRGARAPRVDDRSDGGRPRPQGVAPVDDGDGDVSGSTRRSRTPSSGRRRWRASQGVELLVNSGWRSRAHQERLYEEAIAKYGSPEVARRWVLPPDESAHVQGKAVDVGPPAAARWLERER